MMGNGRITGYDILISILLGTFVFVMLLVTSDSIGLVRDEGFYMKAAGIMADWYEYSVEQVATGDVTAPFTSDTIRKYFSYNNEHPAFMKMLYGAFLAVFHRQTGLLSFVWSMRAVAALIVACIAVMIYIGSTVFFSGRTAGVVAAFLFITMPRVYFHAHLACFDVPVMFFWSLLFLLYAYYTIRPSVMTAFIIAAVFGLSMAVKHNVFFFPVLIVPIWMVFHVAGYRQLPAHKRGFFGLFRSVPLLFYLFPVVSLPVYLLHWPWLWYDTANRFSEYLRFHLEHVNYTNYYFGQELAHGPFPVSFPWGMTLFTTPLPQLVVFIAGIVLLVIILVRRYNILSQRHAAAILLTGILFPVVLISLPSVPIFGGIKHWFIGYPLLCIVGTVVVVRGIRTLASRIGNNVVAGLTEAFLHAAVFAAIALPVALFSLRGPAFFNTLIGGVQGAANLRMQRNFWGYDIMGLVDNLNATAPHNATVYIMSYAEGLNWKSFRFLKKQGIVRRDIRAVNSLDRADFAFFFFEKQNESVLYNIYEEFGTAVPVALSEVDSVLYSALFRRVR